MSLRIHRIPRGFTLPIVLVAMTGLLVLLLGLVTIVGLERRSAKAHADGYRAELAARSALAEVEVLLAEHTANDEYVIFNAPFEFSFDDDGDGQLEAKETRVRSYPFLARAKEDEGGGRSFEYEPLYSASDKPDSTNLLESPDELFLPADDKDKVSLKGLPWEGRPVVAWRNVEDGDGKVVARYAYWLEDTEAYLDPGLLSPADASVERVRPNSLWPDDWPGDWPNLFPSDDLEYPPPWPAPGLNPDAGKVDEPLLAHVGAFTINDPSSEIDSVDFDERVFRSNQVAPTRDSLVAAMGAVGPLRRDSEGHLVLDELRQVEENFTASNEPYDELALVPAVEGVASDMIGEPKLNLNAMLAKDRSEAVDEMSDQILRALPQFGAERKGGFHENYEKTLAANVLDYADADSDPTVEEGVYRGVDSYPMINEMLVTATFEWIKHSDDNDPAAADVFIGRTVKRPDKRVHVYLTVEVFVEVWNMSPHRSEGSISVSYDEGATVGDGGIGIGGGPSLRDPDILNRSALAIGVGQGGSIHELTLEDDDRYYFPAKEVTLEGGEHRVIRMGAVKYRIDIGDSETTPYVAVLELNYDTVPWPECRMRWNEKLIDWTREMERVDGFGPREHQQQTANTLGSSYGVLGGFLNGNGDIRHGYYVQSSQNWSAYPANHSPNRRNVRYRIYRGGNNTPWGRVLPSEWTDGGHDASFDFDTFKWETKENPEPRPDEMWNNPARSEPDHAPSKISNLGRFYSETELGNIFDPVMWSVESSSRGQIEDWARELDGDVNPSSALGGGNTLRIGRPEHELFSPTSSPRPDLEAARFLDLFHVGKPFSSDQDQREGDLVRRQGHVNINTAPRDVLRALVAGYLASDPLIGISLAARHDKDRLAPRLLSGPSYSPPRQSGSEADALADAIIAARPFVSVSEVANIVYQAPETPSKLDGVRVPGNREFYAPGDKIQWSDSAAEESFARLYNSATVRSRNFRVHVVGQAVREVGGDLQVLSTRKKVFKVFSDSGKRDDDGMIDPNEVEVTTIYEKNS